VDDGTVAQISPFLEKEIQLVAADEEGFILPHNNNNKQKNNQVSKVKRTYDLEFRRVSDEGIATASGEVAWFPQMLILAAAIILSKLVHVDLPGRWCPGEHLHLLPCRGPC